MRRVIIVSLVAVAGCTSSGSRPSTTSSPPESPPGPASRSGDALVRRAIDELGTFTGWLDRFRVRGYIGEVGWPDDEKQDASRWNILAEQWFRGADAAKLWVTVW